MEYVIVKQRLSLIAVLFWLQWNLFSINAAEKAFFSLNTNSGLSDNCVLQMLQIDDGRILLATRKGINIYDGMQFSFIPYDNSCTMPLSGYKGATHLYVDDKQRLWIKDRKTVYVVDLKTQKAIKDPQQLLSTMGLNGVFDCFIDREHRLWIVNHDGLVQASSKQLYRLDKQQGTIQDLIAMRNLLYVFFSKGSVACYDMRTSRLLYTSHAYDSETATHYDLTSLVVPGHDGYFYQIRTGGKGKSIFLRFNTYTHYWQTIYKSKHFFHTLIITPKHSAYVSTTDGYLRFDTRSLSVDRLSSLRLPDGNLLHMGLNTICLDREGGVWLGTYDRGVLYAPPLSSVFDTHRVNVPVIPVLTGLYVEGRRMVAGSTINGKTVMPVESPYLKDLTLPYNANAIAFRFSAMCFAKPRDTHYRYRLDDDEWISASADNNGGLVDDRGMLYLSFAGLTPGKYRLQVMASSDGISWKGDAYTLTFSILPPWWATWWAILIYVLMALTAVSLTIRSYLNSVKRHMEQKEHEEMLMMRIRDLVDKINSTKGNCSVVLFDTENISHKDTFQEQLGEREETSQMSRQDMEFMQRATLLVEKNMANTKYNVEALSHDLCMERTGLYKRLTAILNQSPVTFIRAIRLKRAAEMLKENRYTVTEISELTGFSSPGYFSKCFQKEFGCKPTEYNKL